MNKENPFLKDYPVLTKDVSFYTKHKRDLGGGKKQKVEVTDMREIEVYGSTRFYRNNENSKVVYKLTPPGLKLFFYILFNLGKNKDRIELNNKKVCKILDVSSKTFERGITNLKASKIIQMYYGRINVWWVNTNYAYYGERINTMRKEYGDHVVVNSPSYQEDEF